MPNAGKPADRDVPGPAKNDTGSNDSTTEPPLVDEADIAGSMHTEEPDGWDQAPQAIDNVREKRHPRPDGVGGIEPPKSKDRASDRM